MFILLLASSGLESIVQAVTLLIMFLIVLVITFFATKWLAKYQQGQTVNRNFKVIETFRIAPQKFLQIIEVGEKYIVISVCKDTVTMLTELDRETVRELPEQTLQINESFQEVLQKIRNREEKK